MNKLIVTLIILACMLMSACAVYDMEMEKEAVVETVLPVNDEETEAFYTTTTANNLRKLASSVNYLHGLFNNTIDDEEEITEIYLEILDISVPPDDQYDKLGAENKRKYEPTLVLTKELNALIISMSDDVKKANVSYNANHLTNAKSKLVKVEELTYKVVEQFEIDRKK